jgi:hypothetical protein
LPTWMMSWPSEISSHTVLLVVQGVAALVDVGELDGVADAQLAAVGLLLADHHAEQGGLAGAVGADDADDAAARQVEAQVRRSAAGRRRPCAGLGLDDQVAQARARRDVEFVGLVALLVVLEQLLEARQARLALGLAALGVGAHPLQLLLHGA